MAGRMGAACMLHLAAWAAGLTGCGPGLWVSDQTAEPDKAQLQFGQLIEAVGKYAMLIIVHTHGQSQLRGIYGQYAFVLTIRLYPNHVLAKLEKLSCLNP